MGSTFIALMSFSGWLVSTIIDTEGATNLLILRGELSVAAKRFFVLSLKLANPPIQEAWVYADQPRDLRCGLTTIDNAA